MIIWEVAAIILIINVPFGYWRANVRRLSAQWFLAIHLPVPIVIALRLTSGLGWQLATIPILVAVFFAGQFLGTKLHRWWSKRARVPLTSCLVVDVVHVLQAGR